MARDDHRADPRRTDWQRDRRDRPPLHPAQQPELPPIDRRGSDRRRRPLHDRGMPGESPGAAERDTEDLPGALVQRITQAGGHGRPDLARPEAPPRDRARRRGRRRGRPAGRRRRGRRDRARSQGARLGRGLDPDRPRRDVPPRAARPRRHASPPRPDQGGDDRRYHRDHAQGRSRGSSRSRSTRSSRSGSEDS